MDGMEFGFAAMAIFIETRCVLFRYPMVRLSFSSICYPKCRTESQQLWNAMPELSFNPFEYLPVIGRDPKVLAGINRTLLSDQAMLLSTVASGVLLAILYHRGRNDQVRLLASPSPQPGY